MSENAEITAIQAVSARLAAAWSTGDAAAYGAEFTDDADYVVFNGHHLKGRKAIEDTHRWLFDGPLKGTQLGVRADAAAPPVRFLRPDVAVVVSSGGVATSGSPEPDASQDSVQTTVFVKNDGEWQIASFQNTRKAV